MRFSKSAKTARITQFPVHKRIGVMLGEENQMFSFKVLGPVAGRQCLPVHPLKKKKNAAPGPAMFYSQGRRSPIGWITSRK